MPKYIIKDEKQLNEFMGSFFNWIGKRKGKELAKQLKNDPQMVKYVDDANDLSKRIAKHMRDKAKKDPAYKSSMKAVQDFIDN
tara:strand:- start:823 stop:1071 length:249 start_codon:yes stop_codon:yes gene_type:complete